MAIEIMLNRNMSDGMSDFWSYADKMKAPLMYAAGLALGMGGLVVATETVAAAGALSGRNAADYIIDIVAAPFRLIRYIMLTVLGLFWDQARQIRDLAGDIDGDGQKEGFTKEVWDKAKDIFGL